MDGQTGEKSLKIEELEAPQNPQAEPHDLGEPVSGAGGSLERETRKTREYMRKLAMKRLGLLVAGRKLDSIRLQELIRSQQSEVNSAQKLLQLINADNNGIDDQSYRAILDSMHAESVETLVAKLKSTREQAKKAEAEIAVSNGKPSAETDPRLRQQRLSSIVDNLARRPRQYLEQQLSQVNEEHSYLNNELGSSAREISSNDSPEIQDKKLRLRLLEVRRNQLAQALVERNLANHTYALNFSFEDISKQTDGLKPTDENGQAAVKRIREAAGKLSIDANLPEGLSEAEFVARLKKLDDQEYLALIEELRTASEALGISINAETQANYADAEAKRDRKIEKYQKADKLNAVAEIIDTLPKTKLALLREQVLKAEGSELDNLLDSYFKEISTPENIATLKKIFHVGEEYPAVETDQQEVNPQKRGQLDSLIIKLESGQLLNAEEKDLLFLSLSSANTQIELNTLIAEIKSGVLTEQSLLKGLPEKLKQRIESLVNAKEGSLISGLEGLATDLETNPNDEAEVVGSFQELEGLFRMTADSIAHVQELEKRIAYAGEEITEVIKLRWKDIQNGERRESDVGQTELDKDNILPYSEIRRIFNMYGLGKLDFDNPAETTAFKERLISRLNQSSSEVGTARLNQLATELLDLITDPSGRFESPETVDMWVMKASEAEQSARRLVADAFHREALVPGELTGEDANGRPIYLVDPLARELYDNLLKFRNSQEQTQAFVSKRNTEAQKRFLQKNLVFSSLINRLGDNISAEQRAQIKAAFNSFDSQSAVVSTIMPQIIPMLDQSQAGVVEEVFNQIESTFNTTSYKLEATPAGLLLIIDKTKLKPLLGIATDNSVSAELDIEGANLNPELLISQDGAESFPGGIAIVGTNVETSGDKRAEFIRYEELQHRLDDMIEGLIMPRDQLYFRRDELAETTEEMTDKGNIPGFYKRLGMDELAIDIQGFEITDGAPRLNPLSPNNKPNLFDLNVAPTKTQLEAAQGSPGQQAKELAKLDQNQKYAYVVQQMVWEIFRTETNPDRRKALKSDLNHLVRLYGDNPGLLIQALADNYPDTKFAGNFDLADIHRLNTLFTGKVTGITDLDLFGGKYDQLDARQQTAVREAIANTLFESYIRPDKKLPEAASNRERLETLKSFVKKYSGSDADISDTLNPYTNSTVADTPADFTETAKVLNNASENYKFAMHYVGDLKRTEAANEGIMSIFRFSRPEEDKSIEDLYDGDTNREAGAGDNLDLLGFDKKLGAYYDESGFGELKTSFRASDVVWNRQKTASSYEENYPFNLLWWAPKPIQQISAMTISPIVQRGLKLVMPVNTRDILSGFPKFGGASGFRPTNRAKQWGQILGRARELHLGETKPGLVAKYSYPGHTYPAEIGKLNVEDRHLSVNLAIQDNLQGKVASGEQQSLYEKIPSLNLIVPPGDRATFSPKINTDKLDRITQSEFLRIQSEVFNRNLAPAERMDYTSYGSPKGMDLGEGYQVTVNNDGNIVMIPKDSNKELILSEETLLDREGKKIMEEKGGAAFYKDFRPQEVKYKGEHFWVHYNPKTGIPGLYKQDSIDWTAKNVPEPHYDTIDKKRVLVQPRFCEMLRVPGASRHLLNMDQAVVGLFNQIMKTREKQLNTTNPRTGKNYTAEELYSLKDLVLSIKHFEDPFFKEEDAPFVRMVPYIDRFNRPRKYKQIYIPDVGGDPAKGTEVDYEVAMELLNKIDKFYIRDNIYRKAYVKKSQPEHVIDESAVPFNEKIRESVQMYIQLIMDPDLSDKSKDRTLEEEVREYYNLKAKKERGEKVDETEYRRLDRINTKYIELTDYEMLLHDNEYSMFSLKSRKDIENFRNSIRDSVSTWLGEKIEAAKTNAAYIKQAEDNVKNSEKIKREAEKSKLSGSDLDNFLNRKTQEELYAIIQKEVIEPNLVDEARHRSSRGGTAILNNEGAQTITITGYLIDRILGATDSSLPVDNYQMLGKDGTVEMISADVIAAVNAVPHELRNKNYDKRTFVRFMDRFSKDELKRTFGDIENGINDGLKYRQEMKDYTVRVMEKAQNFLSEFERYKVAKTWWESMERRLRKMSYVVTYGAAAALLATGSPAAFLVLLGGLGGLKYITPFAEKWTTTAAQRRNYARDLEQRYGDRAAQILEMFQKGQTLDYRGKKSMEQLLVDMDILLESVQSKNFPENGWAPKGSFLVDEVLGYLITGESSLVAQALSDK